MKSIERKSCIEDQLIGLRVVRNPDCWAWGTQDGGEGSVGTVVGIVGNTQNPRNVKVRWDSGEEFVYRIGAEDAYDLRVLDNSTIGVKHPGVTCQGCQENIVGFRWQCSDCSEPNNLCTFCFTNEKHNLSHVNFKRYDQPSSDPISVRFDSDEQKIQLKGIFPGALVGGGINWSYHKEDGGFPSVGKVVPSPNGQHGGTPGKVWVQWPHEKDKSYSYRVGFNGKMDLEMVSAGVGGHYQPHTLPILKISKPKLDEKTNDVALPLVVGDTVRVTVGLEELRELVVDCGLKWIPSKMGKMVNEVGEVKYVHKNFVAVEFPNIGTFCIPEKALKRLIPWLPVDSVVQVSNGPDMVGNFGCVKKVNSDGTTVEMEFLESGENKTISVSQLKKEIVDTSLVKMGELIRENKGTEALSVHLLVLEVDKGAALSVEYLLQNFPNIVDCRSSYNGTNCTALSVACQKGNLEMVKLLLQCKASVNIKDEDEDDDKICNRPIIQAPIIHYSGPLDENNSKERCNGPIHHAVLGNHPEILKHLLENGASPNDKDFFENTPLHLAAAYGYVECLKLLLEDQRCDLSLTHDWGKTAFTLAVESPVQSLEMFNLFYTTIKLKLNLTDEDYRKVLPLAAKNNHIEAVKTILSSPEGKNVAKILYHNETPLYMACESAHNQIAKLLVSHVGKDEHGKPWAIDTKEGWGGKTPLMRVTKDCNYELIEFLVEAGANLLATDETGDTPFHYAVRLFRKKEKYLIKHPNEATAPQISKIYNQLKTKRPDEYLCPSAAIVYYLFSKGRMPKNLKLPDIKKHIDDNFLYEEIIKICPDFNSMALISKDQRNSLEGSHQPSVLDEFSGLETGSTNLIITDPTLFERISSGPTTQQQNTFSLSSPATFRVLDNNQEQSQSGMSMICNSLNTEQLGLATALSPSLVFPAWSPATFNSVVNDVMSKPTLGDHNSLLPLEYNREQSQSGMPMIYDSLNTEQLGWPPAWSPSACLNAITDVERAAATNETTTVNNENNWSDAETNRESYMPDETINSQQRRTNDQLTAGAHLLTQNLNSQQCSPNLQIQLNVADNLNSESHGDIPEKTQECVSDTVENGNQLHQSNHTTTMQQQTIFPSSSEESIPNVSTTAVDPVIIGTSEQEEELTCKIEKRKKEDKFSWIIIDGQKRRYSQRKKNVPDIFQCTANVSEKNKKCKGTINVENLEGKLEEWKIDREKTFTFTVRNAHEKHLPPKRSRSSTVTETSLPSNKKRKT